MVAPIPILFLLLKSEQPRDWHGRFASQSSEHIESIEQARAWWREHLGGHTMALTVHSAGGKKPPIKIKVRFDPTNDHAFTDDVGGRQKTGDRAFDVRRAQAMSRITQVIEHPKARARNYNADLLFEAPINGEHLTVVLTWLEGARLYEFRSAHFKPAADVKRLLAQQDRQKNKGPLQKGGPFADFASLRGAQRRGSPAGGYHPNGAGIDLHKPSLPKLGGGGNAIPMLFLSR